MQRETRRVRKRDSREGVVVPLACEEPEERGVCEARDACPAVTCVDVGTRVDGIPVRRTRVRCALAYANPATSPARSQTTHGQTACAPAKMARMPSTLGGVSSNDTCVAATNGA